MLRDWASWLVATSGRGGEFTQPKKRNFDLLCRESMVRGILSTSGCSGLKGLVDSTQALHREREREVMYRLTFYPCNWRQQKMDARGNGNVGGKRVRSGGGHQEISSVRYICTGSSKKNPA